jgi:hypothetical protein
MEDIVRTGIIAPDAITESYDQRSLGLTAKAELNLSDEIIDPLWVELEIA